MNIKFIIMTQKSPAYFEDARKEYEKRLSRYCKLKTILVKNPEKALKAVDSKAPVVLLRRGGDLISSEGLADLISSAEVSGISSVNLVAAEGFDYEGEVSGSFSITPLDLDRDLISVVALEQIYRAYKIISGEKYHK